MDGTPRASYAAVRDAIRAPKSTPLIVADSDDAGGRAVGIDESLDPHDRRNQIVERGGPRRHDE